MAAKKSTVHFVSLGCPKNRVDSEVMLGHLVEGGYTPVSDAAGADVVVVNTCGFIDAAKEESIDAIAEVAELRRGGQVGRLVVTGCLSQRYAPELAESLPEVDHFLGTGNFEAIAGVLGGGSATGHSRLPVLGGARPHPRLRGRGRLVPFAHQPRPGAARPIAIPDPDFTLTAASPRVATQARHSVYLKISEGCSNTCAFCIIPKLRGPQRSRPIDDVVREAERLVQGGAREIILVAQDLCAYGRDLPHKATLAALLRALDALCVPAGQSLWIRCLYAYPRGLTEEVMAAMAGARHIVPYLDMPLQHINDALLRRMRRGRGADATRALLARLRTRVPNLVLRTTFIAGLPGEDDAAFAELCDFVREERFARVGVFAYSREDDTPAGEMADQVPLALAEARRDELMAIQREISRAQQQALVGTVQQVLVEGVSGESELLLEGRHRGQAPDVDGVTYITAGTASPGDVVAVAVDQAGDYDVAGPIVGALDDVSASPAAAPLAVAG